MELAALQISFRMDGQDSLAGEKSFMYGPSPGNIVGITLM